MVENLRTLSAEICLILRQGEQLCAMSVVSSCCFNTADGSRYNTAADRPKQLPRYLYCLESSIHWRQNPAEKSYHGLVWWAGDIVGSHERSAVAVLSVPGWMYRHKHGNEGWNWEGTLCSFEGERVVRSIQQHFLNCHPTFISPFSFEN